MSLGVIRIKRAAKDPLAVRPLSRFAAWLCVTVLLLALPARALDMTVSVAQRGGALKKAGLGSLFGASALAGGTSASNLSNSILYVAQSQGRIGENGSNPFSTEAVAPVIRGKGVKMMCRFGDLCYGWPYVWPGLDSWLAQVTNAVQSINAYADVVYAIAIFNEPDGQLLGSDFGSDPLIPGTDHYDRINWVWTRTFQAIRSLNPTVKIMGPNYWQYTPWSNAAHQTRMSNFLQNAISTGTVPNIIGWHSLGPSPGDVPAALTGYYRPLEAQLNVPGRPLPVSIEEYGPESGDFEGVPGTMVKHWAEYERYGIDFACMGIYNNSGLAGNVLRHSWDTNALPNAGWWMMNWYRQMQGEYVPVSRWDTRYYQAFDGVASWNSANQTLTLILGGSDDIADVHFNGLGTLGLGTTVRVRLDVAPWTLNHDERDTAVERGGDPVSSPVNLLDRNFALDASGNLTVPLHRIESYHGYRILISPSNSPANYPTKCEAENSSWNHVVLHSGPDGKCMASGGAYVGGIDYPDSFLCFRVTAPSNGLYQMLVRYACNTNAFPPASQFVTVNGQCQGVINYPGTAGWANYDMRLASKLVSLVQGRNDLVLSYATNYAEIDFIDVRPNAHRYEAEFAGTNNVALRRFASEIITPNYVGGIGFTDSYVDFSARVPVNGYYMLTIAYANGGSSTATHLLSVNGVSRGSVAYAPTGGSLGRSGGPNAVRKTVTVPIRLNEGLNSIRLQKGNNSAELDYITVAPSTGGTPPVPLLKIQKDTVDTGLLSWPTPATGYSLQQGLSLSNGAWSNVTNPVGTVGNKKLVTVQTAGGFQFFRLFP